MNDDYSVLRAGDAPDFTGDHAAESRGHEGFWPTG